MHIWSTSRCFVDESLFFADETLFCCKRFDKRFSIGSFQVNPFQFVFTKSISTGFESHLKLQQTDHVDLTFIYYAD